MFKMALRATMMSTFVTPLVACIVYLATNLNSYSTGTLIFAIGLSAVFAIYVAAATEVFNGLFKRYRHPSLAIPTMILIGVLCYLMVSRALGAPLFSDSIKNGIVGCVYFNAFAGCVLYLGYRENNSVAFYTFSGMIAGFMFHPFLTVAGLVGTPSLNLAFAGSIAGALIAFVHRLFFNHILKNEIKNSSRRRI